VTASRYVHSRALLDGGEGDYSLDITEDPSTNYVRWVADICGPHLGRRLLDVGAGFGSVTSHLVEGRDVTVLDTSPACVEALRARFDGLPNVKVVQGDLSGVDGEVFDSVLLTNVLEHIRDDDAFLAQLAARLVPGGTIVIYVPALNGLYTGWDRKVGHYRRYSKKRIAGVVADAGMSVSEVRYMNFLAIPAWMVSGRLVGRDDRIVKSLDWWDKFAIPLSRSVETRVHPPLGLNLFCVARRA
jgi:SAM-dependent methyltransferase